MNKAILMAGLVPAILVADLASAAEIYNKYGTKVDLYAGINARRVFTSDTNYDQTLADIGFYGESKISEKLTGYGFWQTRITEGANEWSQYAGVRQQYVGLKMEKFGKLDYGRSFGILYDIGGLTDVAPYYSGETWTANADNYLVNHGSNLLTYRNEDLFGMVKGLDFALQYQGKKTGFDVDKNNGEGYGASIGYDLFENFTLKSAYSRSLRTDDQNTAEWQDPRYAKAWGVGAVYSTNNLYLAALYAETQNMTKLVLDNSTGTDFLATADKFKDFEVVAQYQFNNGFRPSISYVKSKASDEFAGDYNYAEYIQAGVVYKMSGSVHLWFDHRFNLNDDPVNSYYSSIYSNQSAAGIIFMF